MDIIKRRALQEREKSECRAYENENALPLGYTYDSYIPESEYEKMDVVKKQQALMDGVVLEEK